MKCYKCGGTLTKGARCPQCGADVSAYKEALKASNAYYNLGLAKARIRDLSGAVESLKMSIVIYKNHIEARNLLGLVYCEMGEVVEALSEWVMSKNLKPDDNPAGAYITQIQSNQGRFELITTMIKKYNLSLRYAKEQNYDMAMLQVKKVVSQNPQLIKAQQLLALLYMREKEYTRARKHLNAVLKIDRNNTLAHLYLQEIDAELQAKKKETASGSFLPKKREKYAEQKPLSGNDVIMPRSSYKEPSNGAITVVNILVGVAIGAALIWFLIVPSRYKGITADYNRSLQEYSEQLSSSNVELNAMSDQLEQVKRDKEALEQRLEQVNGTDGSNKLLASVISAANSYLANKMTEAAEALVEVDVSALPAEAAKSLYNTISEATMTSAATDLYNQGYAAYNKTEYSRAADFFARAYRCDSTRADAAYYAAKSYVALNQTEDALKYYQYIVDEFPSSNYYSEARAYVTSH